MSTSNVPVTPLFTAEDVRQFFYCPRIIYFRYVMRARVRPTLKMERGKEIHREKYRPRSHEREGNVERYYNIYVSSEKFGLACLIDILEVEGEEIRIVEVKTGRIPDDGEISEHQRAQVVAQALLVEEALGRSVKRVGIKYEDKNEGGGKILWVHISDKDRVDVLRALEKMRSIVLMEDIPPPTPFRGRCVDCEYRAYCGDV